MGYMVKFNGDTVAWKSTRQRSRGNSTTDSELIAVNACARRCKGLANMHHKIFPENKAPFRLYQDNTSTIKRTGDATTLGQYKDVDAKDKYVVQLIKNGEANVIYLPMAEHFADPLTKPLEFAAFDRHRQYIMESIEDLKATAYRKIMEVEDWATENWRKYFGLEETWALEDGEAYHRRKAIDYGTVGTGMWRRCAGGTGGWARQGAHMARQQVCGSGRRARAVNKRYWIGMGLWRG